MPGIIYSGTNYKHCKGGNGGTMGKAGSGAGYNAFVTYSPEGSLIAPNGFYYRCAGTGGTSANGNSGGGGGAGAYPKSKGGNGGSAD